MRAYRGGGRASPTAGGCSRAQGEGTSRWKLAFVVLPGRASGEGGVPGNLPRLGARIQLSARLPRGSHEGIEEPQCSRIFPVSLFRPVHT